MSTTEEDAPDHDLSGLTAPRSTGRAPAGLGRVAEVATMSSATVAELLPMLGPGAELAQILTALDHEPSDVPAAVEVVAAFKRLEAWAASRAARAAAALSEMPELNVDHPVDANGRHRPTNIAADELAPRLGLTRHAAQRLVSNGRAFGRSLCQTGDALDAGLIDYAKADLIHRNLHRLALEITVPVEAHVLARAPHRTRGQVQHDLARAIIAVAPDEADDRARRAVQERRVNHPRPLPDGMASIFAVMPAPDAVALDLALEAAARAAKNTGDGRTLDQLRADSLSLMGHTALDSGFIGRSATSDDDRPVRRPAHCNEAGGDAGDGARSPSDHGHAPPGPGSPGTAAQCGHGGSDPSGEQCARGESDVPVDDPLDGPGASCERCRPTAPRPPRFGSAPPPPGARDPGSCPQVRLGQIGGGRTRINVTVPITALIPRARLDGNGDDGSDAQSPLSTKRAAVAELEGYGPVPDVVARGLALGGVWQRLLTDPRSGAVLDVGRTRYQPPAALAEHVRHRDGSCVAPGCAVPARRCDLDHVMPWQSGGATSAENLQALCPRHHDTKTIGAFISRRDADGSYTYVSRASGQRYRRTPDGLVERLSPLRPEEVADLVNPDSIAQAARMPGAWAGDPPF